MNAVRPEHVRDLVRVGDDGRRPERQHKPRELVDEELRRLEVHVCVDEPGHDVPSRRVEHLAALVLAQAGDESVADRHVDVEPLPREDRQDTPAADDEVGGLVAAGDGDPAGEAHRPTMSSGRTGTRVSSRPVASRSAETTAAVETTVGGSPTPFSPYGASGSGSSISTAATGGMSRNGRDQVVGEARVRDQAVPGLDLLHQREAEALRGPALDLALRPPAG